jgi:cobalt-zinc-cadmium efflux system outer membrane protein
VLFLLWILSLNAIAEEKNICGSLSKSDDVLECVKSKSPEAERLAQEKEASFNEAKATIRWLNPELQNQSLFGKNLGNEQAQIQIGLMQTIELGAKRSSKQSVADALELKAVANYQIGLGNELRQTGSDLVRLYHLKQELSSVEEALETFNKLIGQFNSRPRLGPEQEVTVSVYKLSKGDFLIRKNALLREQDEILGRFKSKLQLTQEQLNPILTHKDAVLPNIVDADFPDQTSPEIKAVDAETSSTLAGLSLARSDFFSDIKVGPLAQFNADGPLKSQLIGFQLTVPFPLWNQNGYGVDSAVQKLKAAEIQSTLKKRIIKEEWTQLVRNYARSKTLLKEIPSPDVIEIRHKKLESQIYRGLVSSALVVESHRSLVDVQKSRHEAELEALNTLWRIRIIQGKISEIHL